MVHRAKKFFAVVFVVGCVFSGVARADIQFPDDELPSESVIPRLDSPRAAMNRTVEFTKKWETKLGYGFLLDEPFYQNGFLSLAQAYSWSETSGISLRYMKWGSGLSDYSNQFASTARNLQFGRAPGPDMGYSLSYDYRFFYGKISFSKKSVIPTVLGSVFEGGMIKYGARSLPFFGLGLVNTYYFTSPGNTSHWGATIGVRIYLRNLVDPLSKDLSSSVAAPAESDFGTTTRASTTFDLGVQYLF